MSPDQAERDIMAAFPECPHCQTKIDGWLDAMPNSRRKLQFTPKIKMFGGMCCCFNIIEFKMSDVSEGVIKPRYVTERTLLRPVSQDDCTHGAGMKVEIPDGVTVNTDEGLKEGPFRANMCKYCGQRVIAGKSRILLDPGAQPQKRPQKPLDDQGDDGGRFSLIDP